MKNKLILLPIVTAAACLWVLGKGHTRINELKEQTSYLRSSLHAEQSSLAAKEPELAGWLAVSSGKGSRKAWEQIAKDLERSLAGASSTDSAYSARFGLLGENDILLSLDEISSMTDLPRNVRWSLRYMLLERLSKLNPLAAIQHCDLSTNNSRDGWIVSASIRRWLSQDPTAAITWLDQKIADGTLGNRSLTGFNRNRLDLELELMRHLARHTPEAAGRRFAGLPKELRDPVLENINSTGGQDVFPRKVFVDLIRANSSTEDSIAAVTRLSVSVPITIDKPFQSVTEYLDEIEATPEERRSVVDKLAASHPLTLTHFGKDPRETIEAMRSWASGQAPGSENQATGFAILQLQQQGKVPDEIALDWIESFYQEAPNDEILISYFSSLPGNDQRERMAALASKITNEAERLRILEMVK